MKEDLVKVSLLEIVARYIDKDVSDMPMEANIVEELGVDSLDLLDISYDIEQELKVKLPLDEWLSTEESSIQQITDVLTLGRIVNYIVEQKQIT